MSCNCAMRRATVRVLPIGIMVTCFACPIFQMFDHWDHGEARGKDTESTLFIVALLVGVAIPVANLFFETTVAARKMRDADFPFVVYHMAISNPPVPVGQPPPVLRI